MDRDQDRLSTLRAEFEAQRLRVLEAGDTDAIGELQELEQRAADPSYWDNAPSVLDQLSDHLKRLGIS